VLSKMKFKNLKKVRQVKYSRNYNFSIDELLEDFQINARNSLQVGANSGHEIPALLRHTQNEVIIFEPLQAPFQVLLEKWQNNRIKLFNYAVGDLNGQMNINVASNNGESSSFLVPKKHLITNPEIHFNTIETVKMIRLDDFLKNEIPDLWILDAQGYELEILKGAQKSISQVKWVVTEIHRAETYEGCVQIDELDQWMNDHGFRRKATHWYEIWGDALYSR
jgi:FkbM family methyltransferase